MRRFNIAALVWVLAACSPSVTAGPERSCETVLRAAPAASVPSLTIRGEWAAFEPQAMTRRADGVFEWRGTLEPRDYAYGFGEQTIDPVALFSRWVAEAEWSRVRVPDCTRPRVVLGALNATAGGTLNASALVERGKQGGKVTPRVFVDGAPLMARSSARRPLAFFSFVERASTSARSTLSA